MAEVKLSEPEIESNLKDLSGWVREGIAIKKTFVRKGFVEAVEFVRQIVPIAEGMDHHPDVRIFAYKRVEVSISTHSAGGLTGKDFELAKKIDALQS